MTGRLELAQGITERLISDKTASRLSQLDASLWGPEAMVEAQQRLNWVRPFDAAAELIPAAQEIRAQLVAAGTDQIVLCGMGGSSLGPEVLSRWADIPLTLLDSTHPDVVARTIHADIEHTTVVVSSKSGSTIETRSHLTCFETAFTAAGINPAERIVIVTDPGSELERYAQSQQYRVFNADPHVGGRFSVLTAFGIVPAVLAGIDVEPIITAARAAANRCVSDTSSNPAIQLASLIAAGLPERYVLCTAETTEPAWGLGDWIEQLVAESTGKSGVGVLPISLARDAAEFTFHASPVTRVTLSSAPELTVSGTDADIAVAGPLGAQFYVWEYATALLGVVMGIDPFNQPDVESAKIAARAALETAGAEQQTVTPVRTEAELLEILTQVVHSSDYVGLHAYIDPSSESFAQVQGLRQRLATALQVPVALGIGPRYLHSTGQLHKGGPKHGVFVQILDQLVTDYRISGAQTGFSELISAQANGDRTVLRSHGKHVSVINAADFFTHHAEEQELS